MWVKYTPLKKMENMKKKERSRTEIIHDMLSVTLDEKNPKKTRIMQKAYLNTATFKKYFNFLLGEGFIANSVSEAGCYELTEKGKNLLKRTKEMNEILLGGKFQ